MKIIVPHHKTKQEVIGIVDRSADDLFAGAAGNSVAISAVQKSWQGSTMSFSFNASFGFISLPLSGTVAVDDHNVTVECELPAMVKNFIGDDKIGKTIATKVKGLLA